MSVLVIGYGNPLRGDDAIGWHVVQELNKLNWTVPPRLESFHQLGPELAEMVSQAKKAVFIDAATGQRPGQINAQRLVPNAMTAASKPPRGGGMFSHHLMPAVLLACARDWYGSYPDTTLFSITGESFKLEEVLSPAVQEALPRLVVRIRDHIQNTQPLTPLSTQ